MANKAYQGKTPQGRKGIDKYATQLISKTKSFSRRSKKSGLSTILALGLLGSLGTGCEGGSGGSSSTTLYEARTGKEVSVENSMLDNTNEYSVTTANGALQYTDVNEPNKGQILYDSEPAALAHRGSSGSSSSNDSSTSDSGSSDSGSGDDSSSDDEQQGGGTGDGGYQ